MEYIEFVAMGFSMLGAFYMSKGVQTMVKSFAAFGLANMLLIVVSLHIGLLPLLIQMVFFGYASYSGLIKFEIDKLLLRSIVVIYIIALYFIIDIREMTFEITLIEVIASTMAIVGAIIIKYNSQRKNAFILYFLADVLFVYIAYTHNMLWFGIQSAFFIYTSFAGYMREYKKENLCIQ